MSKEEIIDLIVKWAPKSEIPLLSLDSIFDFVIEYVGDKEITRLQDITSILNWLNSDDGLLNRQRQTNTSDKNPLEETVKTQTLRPGAKIIIPKPSANDLKFNDMESVQAYLNHQVSSVQSNEDNEDVDVTSFDFTPPWNQYHATIETYPIDEKPHKINNRVLTENKSNANTSKRNKVKTKDLKMTNSLVEPLYQCNLCEKKYKQKSSLNRHEKSHLTKIAPTQSNDVTTKTPQEKSQPNQQLILPTNRKTQNRNIPTIIPLNSSETIST